MLDKMKYSTGCASSLFCEEVSTVTLLFEKWNDCERTVVMYALLKHLSFSTLKFLQVCIENNLTQNVNSEKSKSLTEANANNSEHLKKIISAYRSFSVANLSHIVSKESILLECCYFPKDPDKNFRSKEDIICEVLSMIPLLRPGNDEAKKCYLSLIPFAVEDTLRETVTAELVQQFFSYLLIHPAISNEDRRSLSLWLHHLESHIQSQISSGRRTFYILPNPNDGNPNNVNVSSSTTNSIASKSWQTIAPPTNKRSNQNSNVSLSVESLSNSSSDWNLNILQLPKIKCVNFVSSNNSLGIVTVETNENDVLEDSLISFSKNGTEVLDFEGNSSVNESATNEDAYVENEFMPSKINIDQSRCTVKTRRSNSLTTPITSSAKVSTDFKCSSTFSNSIENLSEISQKQRSFSLSIVNSKDSLLSSVFDTNQSSCIKSSIGMSNMGQWLKSLRLHKYIDLFAHMTYDDMLLTTEEYLHGLGVTKGASHKLAICIEKLKKRFTNLSTLQINFLENKVGISTLIEELANNVLTPMKPIDTSNKDNVAGKFIEVLHIVLETLIKQGLSSAHNEECVNATLWVLERALHNEAFIEHSNILKEYKSKLSIMKTEFVPSNPAKGKHVSCTGKTRWSTSKGRKQETGVKFEAVDSWLRKNSHDGTSLNLICLQKFRNNLTRADNNPVHGFGDQCFIPSSKKHHIGNQSQSFNNLSSSTPSNTPQKHKSASYPSFSNSYFTSGDIINEQESVGNSSTDPNQYERQKHGQSLNNLSNLQNPPNLNNEKFHRQSNNSNPFPEISMMKRRLNSKMKHKNTNLRNGTFITSSRAKLHASSSKEICVTNNKTNQINSQLTQSCNVRNYAPDINTSLEFLCLQMTEQAIN